MQWYQAIFENATDGIMVLDSNGVILNANDKACALHGFTPGELLGMHASILEADEGKGKHTEHLTRILAGEAVVFEATHFKKDGSTFYVEVSAKTVQIAGEAFVQAFYRDITEKKRTREHLNQSQKLESIGVLAGGIAHDFNNVLTAILGYTDIIRRASISNDKVIAGLNVIENAARKAGRMISQLLGFARKNEHEVLPVSLNDVVGDTMRLLERVIGKNIKIELRLEEKIPLVDGDANQIEQVLMNFMVNARDAMPNGGTITVATAGVEAGPGARGVPPYVPAGRYVELSIADTGHGIPEEIRSRIFEPFFTTKEKGKGTGLGLSMAYGVVKDHKGYIALQSRVNQGTTFTVYLPASNKTMPAPRPQPLATIKGSETILVVDDEVTVLDFIKDALESQGYTVLSANNPMNALDIYRKEHKKISLVITDLSMPVMHGRELAKELRVIDPGVKVLEISGYGGVVPGSERSPSDVFMQKPFEPLHLVATVRRMIDERRPRRTAAH